MFCWQKLVLLEPVPPTGKNMSTMSLGHHVNTNPKKLSTGFSMLF